MPICFLFLIGSAVTFDNLPFCHEVVQISLNLARYGEQLLHKLKACSWLIITTSFTEAKAVVVL